MKGLKKKTYTKLLLSGLIGLFLPLTILAQVPDVLVSSSSTNSVKRYDGTTGAYIDDFITSGSGSLNDPQDILFLDNGDVLVSGKGNSKIKRYDGTTGAYKGGFNGQYIADSPVRMAIGPDGYVYVTQWTNFQGVIVRFETSGVYVDEFTSTLVDNPCGMAWDSNNRLYVAAYGTGNNGKVMRFDSLGNSLGTFVPTGQISSPVDLWFADNGELIVLDKKLGEAKRFNHIGSYQGKLVEGLTEAEGFGMGSDSLLYICDWTQNEVHRFDLNADTSALFIAAGTLQSPNSIAFSPFTVNTQQRIPLTTFVDVSIAPNPVSETAYFNLKLEKTLDINLEVYNLSGQLLTTVFNGKLSEGNHQLAVPVGGFAKGLYYYVLKTEGRSMSDNFVIR